MSHTILKMNLWFSIESIHFGSPSQESLSQGKGIASVPSYSTALAHFRFLQACILPYHASKGMCGKNSPSTYWC